MTLLMYLCPHKSCVVFEDGLFLLHADGNGTGTQVDQRTLEHLMRLRLISRVRDVDPAQYVNQRKGARRAREAGANHGKLSLPAVPAY